MLRERDTTYRHVGASLTDEKAQRSDSLWPLSFDQESGDTGVGRLSDKFSNHRITHGTIKNRLLNPK